MKTKRARRLVEVVAAGGNPNPRLLGGMSVEEIVQIYRADQERLASDRMKKTLQKRDTFRPRVVRNLTSKVIKWEPNSLRNLPAASSAAVALGLTHTDDVAVADLVVVMDLKELLFKSRCWLYLRGGAVAQLSYIASHGKSGACVVFHPAIAQKQLVIWASADFVVQHPVCHYMVDDAIGMPASKWTWFVGNHVEFIQRAHKRKNIVGLVTKAEFGAFPSDFARVFTATAFLEFICVVSAASQTQ